MNNIMEFRIENPEKYEGKQGDRHYYLSPLYNYIISEFGDSSEQAYCCDIGMFDPSGGYVKWINDKMNKKYHRHDRIKMI